MKGSGEFPGILGKGRTMGRARNFGFGGDSYPRSATLSTSRDGENSQARAVFKGLRGTILPSGSMKE